MDIISDEECEKNFYDHVYRRNQDKFIENYSPECRKNFKACDEAENVIEEILRQFSNDNKYRAFRAYMRIISQCNSLSIYTLRHSGNVFSKMINENSPKLEFYFSEPIEGINQYTCMNRLFYECKFTFNSFPWRIDSKLFEDHPIIIYNPEYNRALIIAALA